MLRKLCQEQTRLSKQDIEQLEKLAEQLPRIANLVKADVFIDCPIDDPDAILVVAEAKPRGAKTISNYKGSVVGELAIRTNEPAAVRTMETGVATRDLKALTQENKKVKQNVEPIKNEAGKIIAVLIMERDITADIKKNKQMEILTETTEQLSDLLSLDESEDVIANYINDAIIIFNNQGYAKYANTVAQKLYSDLGYKDKIKGMHFNNITLGKKQFRELAIEVNSTETFEVSLSNMILKVNYSMMYGEKQIAGLVMLIKDITEVKKKEKKLVLKSVALEEIHHRVKNNLQMIASLLRLQARRVDNEEGRQALIVSINRILSIAVTHDILSQNEINEVCIKSILNKIIENTSAYFLNEQKNIRIKLLGDNFIVDSEKATSIALVVNELLQNSLKHAFEKQENGLIKVKIYHGNNYSNISIIDNGIGFDIQKIKKNRLGFKIVKTIVADKLDGHLDLESSQQGTKIVFDFKNEI
ncbi:Two-component sensor histidine kinase, contains HisKA and HATPase domains [Halanaerobium congolense]|jgi:two-component sensor histidine kinase|uniref:histidine kinase n=1 Tax=Halanaerobium congolense TaxID=54121 RepID=A0A1I0A278_9FIRM|nr:MULTISPECIES: sensor histidine kinase [Halanaerobium]PTX16102.1 two-component sensor histidine kinase [Halanaerobium congolense]PUU95102.1 MAG: signal transduction histidine kinase [Halanaerobium sp.]SDF30476.1 Two-component sensor histidine kinase, contains HisKA and HATPase domains [Halanaerobium congolense]SES87751.1 Two-component sensor histidine kinase, contains HisKA and HATPase domains [Halanaerobium congolense]SFP60707.1 Two-component sensor histidine kinase, contains HisKA and HATP